MLTPYDHRSVRLSNGSADPQSVPATEAIQGESLDSQRSAGSTSEGPRQYDWVRMPRRKGQCLNGVEVMKDLEAGHIVNDHWCH